MEQTAGRCGAYDGNRHPQRVRPANIPDHPPTSAGVIRAASRLPAERLFSKVTRTLTALRSTMAEDRLEALILLQAHREKLPATDELMDRFATSGARRLSL